jgi:hypothetical protein
MCHREETKEVSRTLIVLSKKSDKQAPSGQGDGAQRAGRVVTRKTNQWSNALGG